MKKNRAIAVVALLYLLSGCSFYNGLYIYNLTSDPVTIQYVLKSIDAGPSNAFSLNPEIYSMTSNGDKNKLTKKPDGAIEFDADKKMVTVKLNGKEALQVGILRNTTLGNLEQRKQACSNVERFLIIQNETDTLLCDGALLHLMMLEEELDNHIYGIKIE